MNVPDIFVRTNFLSFVEHSFAGVLVKSGGIAVPLSETEVLIASPQMLLELSADCEGVHMDYLVNWDGHRIARFSMERLLFIQRGFSAGSDATENKEETTSWPTRIKSELNIYADALLTVGMDVLSGDREWIRRHGYEPLPISPTIAATINEVLAQRGYKVPKLR